MCYHTPKATERRHSRPSFRAFCICSIIGLTLLSLHRRLASTSLSIRRDDLGEYDVEWKDFVDDYEKRFQRGPPPAGFDAWFQFARKHRCETRRFYESLDADLAYFRNINNKTSSLLQWDRVIPEGMQWTDNYIAFELENHELNVVAYQTYEQHEQSILHLMTAFLQPLANHSPPLFSKFIFNLHDIPREDFDALQATYPMFSVCKMDYYTDNQQPPSSWRNKNETAIQTYADDLFSKQPKEPHRRGTTTTTANKSIIDSDYYAFAPSKDLLVPYHFDLPFLSQDDSHRKWWQQKCWRQKKCRQQLRALLSRFYHDDGDRQHHHHRGPPPFARRNDVITWRGSTTSPWETGPRFKLLREFGGSGIHPLTSNNNTNNSSNSTVKNAVNQKGGGIVNADFAFTQVVQKPEHVESLSPGLYRFAPYMEYHQMQQSKYILDVDGNGFSSRFPGLLRSGSLVFKSTRYREWFHGRLLPYVDYIPVNYDLTDLVEKVEWVHNQPDTHMAERILQHSLQQVEQHFRPVEKQCYMYRVLLEYQTLFEKPPLQS